jgi:hypothetical protein
MILLYRPTHDKITARQVGLDEGVAFRAAHSITHIVDDLILKETLRRAQLHLFVMSSLSLHVRFG